MNVENILKVADAIEQHSIPDLGFNMASFYDAEAMYGDKSGHGCGTTACIGGWALAVDGRIAQLENINIDAMAEAAEFLELDYGTAFELMIGAGFEKGATPTQDVRTLRHLAATGEVNWDLPDNA